MTWIITATGTVEKGLAGAAPDSQPSFLAMGHLIDSVESFQQAFAPHSKEIFSDFASYTNVEPAIQINKIMI